MGWMELWRVTLMLALIVGLIFGLSAMLKRYGGVRPQGPALFRILGTLSLGNRDRIFLLQVGEEQLLVGSSAAGLRTLHTLQHKVDPDAGAPVLAANQKFADMLRLLGKGWQP